MAEASLDRDPRRTPRLTPSFGQASAWRPRPEPELPLWRDPGALRNLPSDRRARRDRAHRPVRMRKVHLPALPQPDERHHSGSTRVEGEVLLDGEDIYGRSVDVVDLRRRVGMVFQKPNPFPKSIFENVAYGLRINGGRNGARSSRSVSRSRLREAALWDEVKDRLDDSRRSGSRAASSRGSALPARSRSSRK